MRRAVLTADRLDRLANANYWTTADELAFLQERSRRGKIIGGEFVTSAEFLRNYLRGARLRTDWGGLDRESIVGTAEALLDAKGRAA